MNRIEKAVTKCMVYMEKVMTCEPPAGKIPKYTHRLSAVFLDAVHHLSIGKCEAKDAMASSYRKRRDDNDDAIDAEFDALMAGKILEISFLNNLRRFSSFVGNFRCILFTTHVLNLKILKEKF